MRDERADGIVVGGGIAGLTAAALLGRAGKKVILLERSHAIGGRGITTSTEGFHLNLGPHAWYVGGPGTRVLESLGIPLGGNPPKPAATFAIDDGRLHTMPLGFVSLLTTDLLGVHGKFEMARLLASIGRMDTRPFDNMTLEEWLQRIGDEKARRLVETVIRISAYTDAPRVLSAGAALTGLQTVMRSNVRYLHGGWQTLIEALHTSAIAAGVRIMTTSPVATVVREQGSVTGVRLETGEALLARHVVLAVEPSVARRLVGDATFGADWKLLPSRAACLDLALTSYPNRNVIAAFGIDRPLYFAVQSASASLAPQGGAVIHAAKYLDPLKETDPDDDERELEAMVDLLQPGWRKDVKVHRFLPRMTVTHGIPLAEHGGTMGRPSVGVSAVRGLYLAGDWVGPSGFLANAAVASADSAAKLILGARFADHGAAA